MNSNHPAKSVALVFPHQLFENTEWMRQCGTIYVVEETLFFHQYLFHKQKIAFHIASMKYYENYLQQSYKNVYYIDSQNPLCDIRLLIQNIGQQGVEKLHYIDPTDNWLEKRIESASQKAGISTTKYANPLFVNTSQENEVFFSGKKRMFQTDYYKYQRQTRKILLDNGLPLGGKWTYDDENRLKYPKDKTAPKTKFCENNTWHTEAIEYTKQYFGKNYGQCNSDYQYPCTHQESKAWLQEFLKTRFAEFGPYEDAMVSQELVLHHSILSPLLNVGLLTPEYVIRQAENYGLTHPIPLNSLEGFIRQVLGWREFIRAVYELKGSEERRRNYWGFTRKIPKSFWEGNTGIEPLDSTIQKILKTGYCHHIERLMVLGNFMLLCEFDPDEVYRWFMELFIDSYDWVMVPNVYGMSQFADGGLMATKPYISGSNYLMKMSNFPKGQWQETWDGLFWRFMHVHRDFFLQNPRLGMLVKTWDKMPEEKRQGHLLRAESYLGSLERS